MHQAYACLHACADNRFAYVQVLKKHSLSQAVDGTRWETFVTKYLIPF